MGNRCDASDPSGPAAHLPGFSGEESQSFTQRPRLSRARISFRQESLAGIVASLP